MQLNEFLQPDSGEETIDHTLQFYSYFHGTQIAKLVPQHTSIVSFHSAYL